MLFLHSHGVSTSRAVRIFKTYGEQAIEKVRDNPYALAKDIHGIGFATADQIAQKVGIPKDSINRAKAGIDHALLEATSDGHCALPLGKLKLAAAKLLEVPEAIVEQALSQMLTGGSPAAGGNRRRAADLPAPLEEGGRGHRDKSQAAGGNADALSGNRH